MRTKTWKATVELKNGTWQDVFIEADTCAKAESMLEIRYGKHNVKSPVTEIY